MTRSLETQVLIVGAGPVGLTLALDLAWRGIDVIVVERRRLGELPLVRCNHVSARSMEIMRRLGIAKELRQAGLPADYPNDVAFVTAVTGIEFARIRIPSRDRRYTATEGPDTWWPTPEPPHRINQIYLEPVLMTHVQSHSRIRVINGSQVEHFVQDDAGVVATVCDLDAARMFSVSSQYLVGCDGGRSLVRKKIGAKFVGTPVIHRAQSTLVHAPELLNHIPGEPAWLFQVRNPRRCGFVFAIDGRETWLIRNYLREREPDFESVDHDSAIRTILGVSPTFRYDIISKENFVGRRLVADHFRSHRAFICGDAAHLWVPNGGYGMNAGIADAADLAWLIAAVLKGWASPSILDAYEAERQPITEQVSRFATEMALKNVEHRHETPAEIEAAGPLGDAARERAGKEAYELNVRQYCSGGLNFGYFYDRSPIIAYDGVAQPTYTMDEFTPSSVPGCRAPHVWLPGCQSLYDMLGPDYTLLRFDPMVPISRLTAAAAQGGVPIAILDVRTPEAATLYRKKLVLVRPDQHVAWRGDAEPDDPASLIGLVRGECVGPLH